MNDSPAGVDGCLLVPVVPDFALGDWEATERAMSAGVRVELGQPWKKEPNPHYKPGAVRMGVIGAELVAYGMFEDDQPANRARTWNEPTWMTGDVWEFFFQAEGRPGYHEFHVTPEDCRLQLFFPSSAAFREGRGHRHWSSMEKQFASAARVNAERTRWEAVMRVPLDRVFEGPRADATRRFKYLFSRYDYQPGRPAAETSASGKLSRPDFHNIAAWQWAEAALS